jgi:hypothetical protein
MTGLQPQHYITLALAGIALVVWLVRLEGRVNAQRDAMIVHGTALDHAVAKAEAEAKANRATGEALIRLEEAVKHMSRLIEQHYAVTVAATTPRRAPRKVLDE